MITTFKSYEKNNTTERLYKDYVIAISLKNTNIPLFILSIDQLSNIKEDEFFYYKNYSFYKPNETQLTTDYYNGKIRKTQLIIIFQSDDLQECIDMIPILSTQNKFNL